MAIGADTSVRLVKRAAPPGTADAALRVLGVVRLTMTCAGWRYPLLGTLLMWLGVAVTGSDAESNALVGNSSV